MNLGLINRGYPTDTFFDPDGTKTQWQRFEHYVRWLNSNSQDGETYKVLYLARHGEGWHNIQEAKVGTRLWDCYWSRLDGDGNMTWANAELTPVGVEQALKVNEFWKSAIAKVGIPSPETYYVSPLQRCLQTAHITFSDVRFPADKEFKPIIKELLREALGVHTCDRRDTKGTIHGLWPEYKFEAGFSEEEQLWDPDYRESGSQQVHRLLLFLDDIFNSDPNIFISCTSHSGSISSIQEGIGHRNFQLQTGAVMPVFLKGQRKSGPRPDTHVDPPVQSPKFNVITRRL
jgi:broad specificity phosphatase PhoE